MTDLKNLSENELQAMISNAEKALKSKKNSKRKGVITQIRELAASIDMKVELAECDGTEEVEKKPAVKGSRGKVAIKYRNTENADQTWTGRGMMPTWLRALVESGRNIDEFRV